MYSLSKIIQSLLIGNQKSAIEQMKDTDDGRKETTTIRFKPQTRAYLQAQSENLGISVSQLLNIIVEGVINLETAPKTNEIDTLYDRLILLFEVHGISILDTSRMLSKFGITLSKLKSRDAVLDSITPDLLRDVSSWFGIEEGWLIGKKEDKYRENSGWYKNTEGMALYLIEMLIRYRSVEVIAIKRDGIPLDLAEALDDNSSRIDVGFILKYKVEINGVRFYKYEYSEFQRWNYIRCREHLKLMFMFMKELDNHHEGFNFRGCSLDDNTIEQLIRRKLFPSQIEDKLNNNSWHPYDLTDGILSTYNEMNFEKFITSYTSAPMKHFTPNIGMHGYCESWEVDVWAGTKKSHHYLYLHKALVDIYELYHKDKS